MTKIAFVNTTAGPDSTVGRFVSALRDAVVEHGWQANIAAGFARRHDADFVMHSATMHAIGALKHRLTNSDSRCFAKATRRLSQFLTDYSPDLVHLHNLHGYYLHVPILAETFMRMQVPVMITAHDCRLASGRCAVALCHRWRERDCRLCPHPGLYPAVWRRFSGYGRQYRIALDLSPLDLHIVVPSEPMRDILRFSELSHHPVVVIPNGINTQVYNNEGRDTDPDNPRLIAVANSWPRAKNLDALLHLAESMPSEWRLTVVGSLTSSQKRRIQQFDNIIPIGPVDSPSMIADLYRRHNVMLSPSLSESFGLALSEAVACGTPVLSNSEALPRAYIPAKGGLYAPFSDTAAVIRSVTKLLRRKPTDTRQVFSLERTHQAYIDLYRQILSSRK